MKDNIAVAIDWDGKEITVSFDARTKDFEKLCDAAHRAFHNEGKWTIRLDFVNGKEVDDTKKYHA